MEKIYSKFFAFERKQSKHDPINQFKSTISTLPLSIFWLKHFGSLILKKNENGEFFFGKFLNFRNIFFHRLFVCLFVCLHLLSLTSLHLKIFVKVFYFLLNYLNWGLSKKNLLWTKKKEKKFPKNPCFTRKTLQTNCQHFFLKVK